MDNPSEGYMPLTDNTSEDDVNLMQNTSGNYMFNAQH